MILSKDIEIEIVNEKPPIWDEVHKHFDIDDNDTFYTYGDKIYNPAGRYVPDHIIEHESVHARQQKEIGGPDIWWKKYIEDDAFRMDQELEAYGRQYWFYCYHEGDRNKRAKFLWAIASHLSGPTYKLTINHADARVGIIAHAERYD